MIARRDQALKARFNPIDEFSTRKNELVLDVNRAFSAGVLCAMLPWDVAPG
jgi:hypothetical protein